MFLHWVFPTATWLLAAGWAWLALQWRLHRAEVANLAAEPENARQPAELDGQLPRLTVVVPACNEQEKIEATLRSLLASQGVRPHILAVDDRSTDATGAIMNRVAEQAAEQVAEQAANRAALEQKDCARDLAHRLQVLHIRELPAGWLGKPHALATAAALAETEWILFIDGDVEFAPEALARALRYAERERADHLVILPEWIANSRAEVALQGAMHALSSWGLRLWKIADPCARDFLGVGAFNLMRRSSYEALGGFGALRMEVLEDLRMGWRVKRAGMRQRVAYGQSSDLSLVRVRWANGAWGVVRNLEKNIFALYRYRLPVALMACLGMALQAVWPLLAIGLGGWTRVAGILVYVAITGVYAAARPMTRVSPWYAPLFPLASGLFLIAMARSVALTLARGGVKWRGTLYSLRELRAAAGGRW